MAGIKVGKRHLAVAVAIVLLPACGWLPGMAGTFPVTVDNQLEVPAVLEITEFGPPTPGGRYPPALAEPIVVPPGEHLIHLPDPRDQWSLWLRGRLQSFDGSDLRESAARVQRGELGTFRLVINADGMVAEGCC